MKQSPILKRPSLALAALLMLGGGLGARPATAAPAADWIFMDLGEVLVTGNPTAGYTYVPGALAFLKSMRTAGYKLALVSNIPESWGAACSDKYTMLQQFLGSRLHESTPMDWTALDAVIVPPFDRYRKPTAYMFVRALATACPGRALYIGEATPELDIAKQWGYATINPQDSDHVSHLPSLATVAERFQDFNFAHPDLCDYTAHFHEVTLPQDPDLDVSRCVLTP